MVWLTDAMGERIKSGMFVTEVKYFPPLAAAPDRDQGMITLKDLSGLATTLEMMRTAFTPFIGGEDVLIIEFLHTGEKWTCTGPVISYVGNSIESGDRPGAMRITEWLDLQLRAPLAVMPYTFHPSKKEEPKDG